MENIEIWRDIPDYEGLYQVSNFGNVKSLSFNRTGKERLLKPRKDTGGYFQVDLYKNTKRKIFTVHKLVALAFIPNIQNLPQINHKNEIKTDNRVENLEWCDCKYNLNYGTRNERVSKKMKGKHHTEETKKKLRKPITQLTLSGEFIRYWESITQASQELNINNPHIGECCKGKRKTAGGYIWGYKE